MDCRGPTLNSVDTEAEKQGDQGRSCCKGTLKCKRPKCPSTEEKTNKMVCP